MISGGIGSEVEHVLTTVGNRCHSRLRGRRFLRATDKRGGLEIGIDSPVWRIADDETETD